MELTDVKKLWGLAAGRCSYPGCDDECVLFLDANDPTIIGEMAHIIAKKEKGTRGKPGGGPDTYENLILLCPTHHTLIDKAPAEKFPEALLLQWKQAHEEQVRRLFQAPTVTEKVELFAKLRRLLMENHHAWLTYGPDSEEASRNPLSTSAEIWNLRKLSQIVPNNRKIINLIEVNKNLLSDEEYDTSLRFVEHAAGFEASSYSRREGIPRFPKSFEDMVAALQ